MAASLVITEGHVRIAAKPIIGRIDAPIRDYISLFGVSPKVCAAIFTHCRSPFERDDDSVCLVHLLWALLFLKSYHTEAVLVGLARAGCRRTFRKKVWQVLDCLSSEASTLVSKLVFFLPANGWWRWEALCWLLSC